MRRAALLLLVLLTLRCGPDPVPLGDASVTGDLGPNPGFPDACDLLITEVHAAPSGGADVCEFFEIYNNTGQRIASLAGLRLTVSWTTSGGTARTLVHTVPASTAPALDAGAYLAVGSGKPGTCKGIGYQWAALSLVNDPYDPPADKAEQGVSITLHNAGTTGTPGTRTCTCAK